MENNENMCNDSNVSDIYYSDSCKDYENSLNSNSIEFVYSDSSDSISDDEVNILEKDDKKVIVKDKSEMLSETYKTICG